MSWSIKKSIQTRLVKSKNPENGHVIKAMGSMGPSQFDKVGQGEVV